jgi:hypothetical protein
VRKAVLTVVAVATLLVGAGWASAHAVTIGDPNDTTGPLDVRRVEKRYTARPLWRITTGPKWTAREIWDKGYFLVHFDTAGDSSHFERYALIRGTPNGMAASLWRDRQRRSDYRLGPVTVRRASQDSVSIRLSLTRLDISSSRTFYRWFVRSLYSSGRCPRVCIDQAPDGRSIRDPLVAPN